jgi:NAD(P)-dependent dehydrogenase (short-subunit alcohol dehydrogenase family)
MHDVKLDHGPMPSATATPPHLSAVPGQIALVTGAGAGIGAAIAKQLSDAGSSVVLADIDGPALEQVAAEIGNDETTVAYTVDVSDGERVRELIDGIVDRFGRLDLLVNNAGIAQVAPLEDITLESWRRTFAVNVEGTLLLMQAAFTIMRKQSPLSTTGCRGKIVNMSSPASERGRPLLAAYGASKAAINHLSKSAAARWGGDHISTTVVYPGSVTGAMWPGLGIEMAAVEGRSADEVIAKRIAWTPMGRFQEPSEIAAMVLYVANHQGMGLNGRTVWTEPHIA